MPAKMPCRYGGAAARPGQEKVASRKLLVVVARKRLADALGEILGRERGLVALAAQLLDGHGARRVYLGPRNDPRRPILVPHPDVLHSQMEERIARLRHVLEIELVAQVRGVLC